MKYHRPANVFTRPTPARWDLRDEDGNPMTWGRFAGEILAGLLLLGVAPWAIPLAIMALMGG